MIHERILLFNDKQLQRLRDEAEKDGFQDELAYLQLKINELLGENSIAEALTKEIVE